MEAYFMGVEDKRKLKRRHLIYYLRIFEAETGKHIGNLADITQEGIMIISEAPIQTKIIYSLNMVLPNKLRGKKEISFEAKCLWCKKDINPDFYVAGFQFINITESDKELIEMLIDRMGFND